VSDFRESQHSSFDQGFPSRAEFVTLCERLCDGTASSSEIEIVENCLKQYPEARACYQEFLQLHANLWIAANRPEEFQALTTESEQANGILASEPSPNSAEMTTPTAKAGFPQVLTAVVASLLTSARHHPILHTLGIACGVLIAVYIGFLIPAEEPPAELANSTPRAIPVARLQEAHHCEWGTSFAPIDASNELYSGQCLELLSGTAKLVFRGGTTTIVESPAQFELLTDKSMRIEYGTVAAHVTGPKKEFVDRSRSIRRGRGVLCGRGFEGRLRTGRWRISQSTDRWRATQSGLSRSSRRPVCKPARVPLGRDVSELRCRRPRRQVDRRMPL
jgi:hypothetical protein